MGETVNLHFNSRTLSAEMQGLNGSDPTTLSYEVTLIGLPDLRGCRVEAISAATVLSTEISHDTSNNKS